MLVQLFTEFEAICNSVLDCLQEASVLFDVIWHVYDKTIEIHYHVGLRNQFGYKLIHLANLQDVIHVHLLAFLFRFVEQLKEKVRVSLDDDSAQCQDLANLLGLLLRCLLRLFEPTATLPIVERLCSV